MSQAVILHSIISAFNPLRVLKGSVRSGTGGAIFRRILVTSQFTISVVLIIVTLIVTRQLTYIQNKKIGYDRENLVYLYFGDEIRSHLQILKQELLSYPDIHSVTTTNQVPTYIGNSTSGWTWEGKGSTEEVLMHMVQVDIDYLETFRIRMAEGRFYSPEMMNDTAFVVINETASRIISPEGSSIGKFLSIGPYRLSIIGVVRDFHFKSVHRRIEPLILVFLPKDNNILFARISPSNREKTLKYLASTYKKYAGDQPYTIRFLDADFDNLYKAEKRMGTIFSYFAMSCHSYFLSGTIRSFIIYCRAENKGNWHTKGHGGIALFACLDVPAGIFPVGGYCDTACNTRILVCHAAVAREFCISCFHYAV